MADHIVFQRELVGVLLGVRSFRVEKGIAVLGFARRAERQVSLFREEANVLECIGMGERNPDPQRFSGGDTLDGERVVELEMAFALGVGSERCKHDEVCSKAAGNHGNILSAGTGFSWARSERKRPTGVLGGGLR